MNQIPTIIIREPRFFSWEKLLWVLPFLTLGLLITFWPKSQNLIKDEVSVSDSAFIRTPKSLAQKNSSFSDYLAWENPDKNLENENDEDYIPLRLPKYEEDLISENKPTSLLEDEETTDEEGLVSSSKLSSDALDSSSKKKYEYDGSYGYDDSFFTSYPYYDDSFASSFYGNRERENNAPQIESTSTEKSVTEENNRGPSGLMGSFSGPLSKGKKVAPSAASGNQSQTPKSKNDNTGLVSRQSNASNTSSATFKGSSSESNGATSSNPPPAESEETKDSSNKNQTHKFKINIHIFDTFISCEQDKETSDTTAIMSISPELEENIARFAEGKTTYLPLTYNGKHSDPNLYNTLNSFNKSLKSKEAPFEFIYYPSMDSHFLSSIYNIKKEGYFWSYLKKEGNKWKMSSEGINSTILKATSEGTNDFAFALIPFDCGEKAKYITIEEKLTTPNT